MQYHGLQIIRCAAVIEAQLLVHFVTAAPEVPGDHIKSFFKECLCHSLHVRATGITLKSMRDND